MQSPYQTLWEELNTLVLKAGYDGGCASPSVYDTAQCLRLCPPVDPDPIIAWLLNNQCEDGGWCSNASAYQRDVPTLAATVALTGFPNYPGVQNAIRSSTAFLIRQAAKWDRSFRRDWPVSVEVILPALLDQAIASGLNLSSTLYASLRERQQAWLKKLTRYPITAGAPVLYCFEAWGTTANPDWLDSEGSIGNSPAATAHWLSLAQDRPELETARQQAEDYLQRASYVIHAKVCRIYPTLWPLPLFERSFLLHTLQFAGLLQHPRLTKAVTRQAQALSAAMRPAGIGYTDTFMCDGDDTGAAACALIELGYSFDPEILWCYSVEDHFVTYQDELDPSLTTTARIAQALRLQGVSLPHTRRFFREQQSPDGRWVTDKWHASWLYATLQVLAYLAPEGETESVLAAGRAICRSQSPEGAWTVNGVASRMDTVFAILALTILCRHGWATCQIAEAHAHGLCWLRQQQCGSSYPARLDWISKTAYAVPRIERCFELCALLSDPRAIQETDRFTGEVGSSDVNRSEARKHFGTSALCVPQ